jgi:hypothetical protein
MANSNLPGPSGAHHHHRRHRQRAHTADVPAKPPILPRTPGVQGRNDHADPNLTSLLGWTPNLTGVRDWADHTLQEVDHLWHKTLGSIGIEKETGAPVAQGSVPITAPAGQLALDDAHLLALKITTVFEGTGAKSMNYQSLAGSGTAAFDRDPDFDGMATSFGLVQWNFGMGTLGKLLNKMRAANATAFDNCFTANSDYATLKAALIAGNKSDQMTWARDLYSTHAGKQAWKTSFENIGNVEAFNKIQFDTAINDYNPTVVKDIAFLRTLAPALMAKVEFRSYAAMFDCAIQQGGLHKAEAEIKAKAAADKPATQFALMTIAFTERANKASHASVADCKSRRLGILNGKSQSFSDYREGKKPMERTNSQYGIVLTEGTKTVMGL